MAKTFEQIQRENEEWARQHPTGSKAKAAASAESSYGLVNYIRDFFAPAVRVARRVGRIIGVILRPLVVAICFVAPFIEPCAQFLYKIAMTRPGADGRRHFAPRRATCSIIIGICLVAASPFLAMAAYYYGTLRDIDDVYIPDAAVFVNQQFEVANQPGRHVTSRDEIYTVMGRWQEPDGVVEPMRFDIDLNAYFPQYGATMRPDLAAAKLNSQSPYGVRAKLKVTGFYAMLPRFIRFKLVRWFNLRSEIVEVLDVRELTSIPSFAKTIDGAGMDADLQKSLSKPLGVPLNRSRQEIPSSPKPQ